MRKGWTALIVLCLCAACLSAPPARAEDAPLRMGYCESDPYVEFDTQLYHLLLGMEEYGLITGVSERLSANMTAAQLWEIVCRLSAADWRVHFSPGVYVSLIDAPYRTLDEDGLGEAIDEKIREDGVQLMLCMGTSAGQTIAALPSGTPFIDFVSADPVKSGVVAGAETSGMPGRWAHVDVDAFERTLQVMQDVFAPGTVGVVYAGNADAYIYSGADVLDEFCDERGIIVHRRHVEDEFGETEDDYRAYVEQMRQAHEALAKEQIDVYILTTSLLDAEDFAYALEPLLEYAIPVYSINSSFDVECGALMAAEASDFPNIGRFGADTLSRYLGGEPLDTLPQIYQTAPFLVINYDTARRIRYSPSFDMLLSATTIYTDARQEEGQ